jgi:transmembrane protein DUF3566
VDEAGRPTEPSAAADDSDNGTGSVPGVPPLPADQIGRTKTGSPYALGYRSGLAASSGENGSAKGGGPMGDNSAISNSADGDPVDSGTAGHPAGSLYGNKPLNGELLSGAAATLSDKLDSGRQAMRQAATATTSWFANRAGAQMATRPQAEASSQPLPPRPGSPSSSPSPASAASPWTSSAATSAAAQSAGAVGAVGAGAASGVGANARAAGYASSAKPAWQNRVTGSDRRPDPPRQSRRQAHLTLARVEPWSVMKFSFYASIVAFIVLFVAITVLYMTLSALGVFTSLQHTVSTITSSQGTAGTNITGWFSATKILGWTGFLGALNIILITALSTIGAVIYNLIAHVSGGIEVTLRETD